MTKIKARKAPKKAEMKKEAAIKKDAKAKKIAVFKKAAESVKAADARKEAATRKAAEASKAAAAGKATASRQIMARKAAAARKSEQARKAAAAERVVDAERASAVRKSEKAKKMAAAERVAQAERAAVVERAAEAARAAAAERVAAEAKVITEVSNCAGAAEQHEHGVLEPPQAKEFEPDAAVAAWVGAVAAAGGTVSARRVILVDGLIRSLKDCGAWQRLDRLWIFAAENQTQALIDLVGLGEAATVNGPTFIADLGYAFDGSTQYIDTKFNAAAALSPR